MYGVNVLMSESFQSKLSPQMKQGLRRVDVVCLKGSSIPMAIYTCDRSNALWVWDLERGMKGIWLCANNGPRRPWASSFSPWRRVF